MKYSESTTIDQYRAWLDTFPSIAEIRKVSKMVFSSIYRSLNTILKIVRKKKQSSIAKAYVIRTSRTVFPLSYDKNGLSGFNEAAASWSKSEQDKLRDHYECEDPDYLKKYIQSRQTLQTRIQNEIAMEELHYSALQLLKSK